MARQYPQELRERVNRPGSNSMCYPILQLSTLSPRGFNLIGTVRPVSACHGGWVLNFLVGSVARVADLATCVELRVMQARAKLSISVPWSQRLITVDLMSGASGTTSRQHLQLLVCRLSMLPAVTNPFFRVIARWLLSATGRSTTIAISLPY